MMDDMKSQAKVEKLKELRRILRELMAEEGADAEMEAGEIDDLLEEADDASMMSESPELAEESEDGLEESEPELSELEMMKRQYFKPKFSAPQPGRMGAKTMIVAAQSPKASLADVIPAKKSKGKMA